MLVGILEQGEQVVVGEDWAGRHGTEPVVVTDIVAND
jgi:hypothetical protein